MAERKRAAAAQLSDATNALGYPKPYLGRIHLVHLQIHKYFTDDSSVNFHDKVFLHFLLKFRKKMKKKLVMEMYG